MYRQCLAEDKDVLLLHFVSNHVLRVESLLLQNCSMTFDTIFVLTNTLLVYYFELYHPPSNSVQLFLLGAAFQFQQPLSDPPLQ